MFTEAEIAYLRERMRGTIGTVGPDGQPHLTPTTLHYNESEDAIDVGGVSFGSTKKWRKQQCDIWLATGRAPARHHLGRKTFHSRTSRGDPPGAVVAVFVKNRTTTRP